MTDMRNAPESQVPIEVETKYEISNEQREEFLCHLLEKLHFRIVLEGIVTDSFTRIEESKVTRGKDFDRYRHTRGWKDGALVDEVVMNSKWWEAGQNGRDIRRETPDLPVSLANFRMLTPQILVSLVKKRISLAGIVNNKEIHVDMDTLYDYEPSELPADLFSIPAERIRYFIEAERVILDRSEFAEAKALISDFLARECNLSGEEAQGMLSMAMERMGRTS